ncbi:MAG: FCD domain-containing protein [Desulfotignum sp.]|nr:FCD domain-containing protein [Desulfotignum sp.]
MAEPTRKEAEDIFHTRILLESHALEFVARNMTKTRLKKIETYETAFEKKLQSQNLRGILKYNRLFHQSIFETCGNVIVSEMIDQLRNRSRIWYHYIRGDARHREKSIQEHRDMIDCLRAGNADKLKTVNKTHLKSGYKSYTVHLPLME